MVVVQQFESCTTFERKSQTFRLPSSTASRFFTLHSSPVPECFGGRPTWGLFAHVGVNLDGGFP